MGFLKFLMLIFFACSVVAAENSGYIDFGDDTETENTSIPQTDLPNFSNGGSILRAPKQLPDSIGISDERVDDATDELMPWVPEQLPDSIGISEENAVDATDELLPRVPEQRPDSIDVNEESADDSTNEPPPSISNQLPESIGARKERFNNSIRDQIPDSPAQQTGSVRRSHFTSGINNHEPVDDLLSLANDNDFVYFFTELRHLEGQAVTHRWEFNNQVLAEVTFKVGGPRWRVWSKKTLLPNWVGEIQVNVVDEQDRILAAEVLKFTEASQ